MRPLKIASCMAENSESFCRSLAGFLENRIRRPVRYVGGIPWQERELLFDRGEIHMLWLCGLPYVDKADAMPAHLELLAVPVPRGERYQGRPVYFSDVVVRRDRPFFSFEDLRGASWAYNEPRSHSGFNVVRAHLARWQEPGSFFAAAIESGSHSASLEMVARGKVDAAAIDSTVLEWIGERRGALVQQVRVIETLGPSPMPPWVISRALPEPLRARIGGIFLRMHREAFGRALLALAGLARFVAAQDRDYDPIRTMALAAAEVPILSLS
jgi:phosphonate transport system substrate-binding protein